MIKIFQIFFSEKKNIKQVWKPSFIKKVQKLAILALSLQDIKNLLCQKMGLTVIKTGPDVIWGRSPHFWNGGAATELIKKLTKKSSFLATQQLKPESSYLFLTKNFQCGNCFAKESKVKIRLTRERFSKHFKIPRFFHFWASEAIWTRLWTAW